MTRTKRIGISAAFLGICAVLIGHSYWHHYVLGLADAAFTHQRTEQYEEAIAKADEAIKHSGDALGYYVRGASRMKLMDNKQKFVIADLEKCKADSRISRSLASTISRNLALDQGGRTHRQG